LGIVSRIEISWINQPGRIISQMGSYADGFKGTTAIAGIAAVAENGLREKDRAERAVALLRDEFAEGIAYGIKDVLKDAIDEVNASFENGDQDPCSLAVAVILNEEVWVYSEGTCSAFLSGGASSGSAPEGVKDLSCNWINHITLKPGQSIILVSHGLKKLMGSAAARSYSSLCRKPLSFCLSEMVRETRIRFRKKGGSAAAVRMCRGSRGIRLPRRRFIIAAIAVIIAAVLAALILSDLSGEITARKQADSIITDDTVMPLE